MFISPRLALEANAKFFANLIAGLPVKFFEVRRDGEIQERHFIGMLFLGAEWRPVYEWTDDGHPLVSSCPCFWSMTEALCFLDKVEADQ